MPQLFDTQHHGNTYNNIESLQQNILLVLNYVPWDLAKPFFVVSLCLLILCQCLSITPPQDSSKVSNGYLRCNSYSVGGVGSWIQVGKVGVSRQWWNRVRTLYDRELPFHDQSLLHHYQVDQLTLATGSPFLLLPLYRLLEC